MEKWEYVAWNRILKEPVPCFTRGKIVQNIEMTILPHVKQGTNSSPFQVKWRESISV
jgi:hypothetical protein